MAQEVNLTGRQVTDLFHMLYYGLGWNHEQTWANTYWMGVKIYKFPGDLMMYQELIHRIRPKLILETGTREGGSALFFCHMLDLCGIEGGRVWTVDVKSAAHPVSHPRLELVSGSSVDEQVVAQARRAAAGVAGPVMVILDSLHRRDHVLAEMHAYAPLVTPGSYLIVEDTNVNGHPVNPEFGPGPMEAVETFLAGNKDFETDHGCEKFVLTANPSGFLRRKM